MSKITETYEQLLNYTKNLWHDEYHNKLIRYLTQCEIKSYVDVGANIGEVCNILKFYLPELKNAYLFEPQLDNYAFMNERYLKIEDVRCFNYGIHYGVTHLPFYRKNKNIDEYSVEKLEEDYKLVGEVTQLKTLEEFDLPIVDFIKISAEGSEENIIKNSTYIPKIKYISLDFSRSLHNIEDVEAFCSKYFSKHKIVLMDRKNVFLEKQGSYLAFKI